MSPVASHDQASELLQATVKLRLTRNAAAPATKHSPVSCIRLVRSDLPTPRLIECGPVAFTYYCLGG